MDARGEPGGSAERASVAGGASGSIMHSGTADSPRGPGSATSGNTVKLRVIQVAVIVLAAIGIACVATIGLAINDIYNKLDNVTIRLCIVENWQRDSLQAIAAYNHVRLPAFPAVPFLPKPCRAKPDGVG